MDNKILQRMNAEDAAERNGLIMRTIVMVSEYRYTSLKLVRMALADKTRPEDICVSVNYLTDKGYLYTRTTDAEHKVSSVSDTALDELESKWTPLGNELMNGLIKDEKLVKV